LVSQPSYPIYALDLKEGGDLADQRRKTLHMAAGGGADGGFFGVPVYIYDIN
jgi:hypothetical protein